MQKTILFLDKSFVKPAPEHLRGVEIFNLSFIRELMDAGYRVTVVLEESWQAIFKEEFGEEMPESVWIKHFFKDVLNTLKAAFKLRTRKFDFLLLGNVGKGIVPGVYLLKFFSCFKTSLVIANREASRGFIKLAGYLDTCVLAVNKKIAEPFRKIGCTRVFVDYGIPDAAQFMPAENQDQTNTTVNFCLMGMLDNAWKGADTAIEAFKSLSLSERENLELHLASYAEPPTFSAEDKITAYKWFPAEEVAEFLRGMDVMLVLSRDEHIMRETFSQVIVQGMLSGLPVISLDLPILVEKLDVGGGIIVKNLAELKETILKLAKDPALRKSLGAEAREVALERYVWRTDRFIEKYLANS